MLTRQFSREGYLPEYEGHSVFWKCYGNPAGVPVLFLHGGPGCGFEEEYLSLFDLDHVNLVTFDQRGAGRSLPTGKLENNYTAGLIEDIEKLRNLMGIDRWIVAGHSWGTTLAVAYAEVHPEVTTSLALAAFFGGMPKDQSWTFSEISMFFPQQVEYLHSLHQPQHEHLSLDEWIFENLTSDDSQIRKETAYALLALEEASSKNVETPVQIGDATDEIINIYKLLFFYAKNNFFINLEEMYDPSALKCQTTLVHGQFDMDCAPFQAYRLKEVFPHIDLRIVRGGNHSVFESPMSDEYRNAIRECVNDYVSLSQAKPEIFLPFNREP